MCDFDDPFYDERYDDEVLPDLEQPSTEDGIELWKHLGDLIAQLENQEAGFAATVFNTDNPEFSKLMNSKEGLLVTGSWSAHDRPDGSMDLIGLSTKKEDGKKVSLWQRGGGLFG
jgi:hypothetical protein